MNPDYVAIAQRASHRCEYCSATHNISSKQEVQNPYKRSPLQTMLL